MSPRSRVLAWVAFVAGIPACAPMHTGSASGFADLALTHATIVDVESGRQLRDHTVLIAGNRITAVAPTDSVAVPKGARVVDAQGKYLIPGLLDMHVHLHNPLSRRPPNVWAFPLFVANGVTGVREMWTDFTALPTVERWRREISEGGLLAPRVLAAGALVDGPGTWIPGAPEVTTPAEGRRFVREAARAGIDFVKVYSMLPPDVYSAILEEAREVGRPVAGHIPLRVAAREAARAGQRSNEHLSQVREACSTVEGRLLEERRRFYSRSYTAAEETAFLDEQVHRTAQAYDEQSCRAVARDLARAGQWQVPTLANERRWFLGVPAGFARDPRLVYVPPRERQQWQRRLEGTTYTGDSLSLQRGWEATLRVIGALSQAGVRILTGTDVGQPFVLPGFALHDELEIMVEAGLTPLQALQAATLNPALYLEATDSLGSVEAGNLADLVLLDSDPLQDIRATRRIAAVVLNGRYLDRRALDALLAEAERAANPPAQ